MIVISFSFIKRPACGLALLALLVAGCTQLEEIFAPSAPSVSDNWSSVLNEIRAFERRIGFRDTGNFARFSAGDEPNSSCGYVSHFHLPYSYEDPAILWRDAVSEQECLEFAADGDVSFGIIEALGEVNAPMTPSIIASGLDRFLYLVIHEDCHDQFALPYGIEEAVCDLVTYKAMPVLSAERFGWATRAHRAVRRYVQSESRRAHATIAFYGQLAALYSRYHLREVAADAVLLDRAQIFAGAERALGRDAGSMNNVAIANDMTYSRHYPLLERAFDALGRDLARSVAFFKHVDQVKPSRAAVMEKHRIADEKSVEFIRAYEAAVVDTIEKALAEQKAPRQR